MKAIVTLVVILAASGGSLFAAESTAPPTAPAANGLLLEYKFEDGVADSSGNQRHGKLQGKPQFGEGRVGRCLVLDGAGSYIDCGPAPAELGQTFTVECWVKPDPQQNLHADIFGNHAHGGLGFVMQQDGANLNRFAVSLGAGADQWITTRAVPLAAGKWQHVAMVKTPETLSLFLNGVAVASVPATAPMAASPTTLRVGLGFEGLERCFRGSLDEFRVWNRAIAKFSLELSPDEILVPISESLRLQWRSVPSPNGPAGAAQLEFSLPAELTNFFPENLHEVAVVAEAVEWRSNRKLSMPKCTLAKQSGFKSVVDSSLPSGTYTISARPVIALEGRQFAGEACEFSWVADSPVVTLQSGKPAAGDPTALATVRSQIVSLDGPDWRIAIDPKNEGRDKKWFEAPPADTRPTKVPWVIQDIFPEYHGVAWYWREFEAPANPHRGGRYLIRFEAVDYRADVWVNGQPRGGHEGGDTPFELDVTDAIRPGAKNLLAVRVLNPTHEPIDGIVFKQTASGAKNYPITGNMVYNSGGIVDSVALVVAPAIRVEGIFVLSDWKSGEVRVRADVFSAHAGPAESVVQISIADARSGEVMATGTYPQKIASGSGALEAALQVPHHRLWQLDDPALYRVTARVATVDGPSTDEREVRFGFRDFRFENGYFRLNGKRIFPKGCLYTPHFPVGYTVPPDEDMLRQDVTNLKALGFNLCRIVFGGSRARQLDIFDELGVMVHQEHYGSWQMEDSPQLFQRWDRCLGESIVRDRNHASVVAWGLLNETGGDKLFYHAVGSLPFVRALDSSRMIVLNSGRSDGIAAIGSLCNPGSDTWDISQRNLLDLHLYASVPISLEQLAILRTGEHPEKIWGVYGNLKPEEVRDAAVYISEYGQCGPVDLPATLAGYERLGRAQSDEGRYFRRQYEKFQADWDGWRLTEIWARPEDYFDAGHRALAELRKTGETAIRSNPRMAAFCSTHCISDMNYCGAGSATSVFRQLKRHVPETALLANAPLRWCLITEPQSIYRGGRVRLDASLANEDVLAPGNYPARLQVVGPDGKPAFEKTVKVCIPEKTDGKEPPFAQAILTEEIVIAGPPGIYRFSATLEQGAAVKCGDVEFHVTDSAAMPAMPADVVLWGEDPALAKWLAEQGARVLPFDTANPPKRQLILASAKAPAPGGAAVFRDLAAQMARGSQVVFLDPTIFVDAPTNGTRWLPLVHKGLVTPADKVGGYYRADRWAKKHAIFDGLPSGGMMDYRFYRNIISPLALSQDYTVFASGVLERGMTTQLDRPSEAVCGAIRTSYEYGSGLHIGVWNFGAGRFIVNTLRIRENLGADPAAERLLRNMLNYAALGLDKPLAELPADFDQQLKAIGYE